MGLGQSRAPAPPAAAELSRQAAAQTAAPPGHVALAAQSIEDMAAAAAAASRTSHEFQAEVRRRICGRDGSESPQEAWIWGMTSNRAPAVNRALTLLELAETKHDNPARLFKNMLRREKLSASFCASAAASVTLGELEDDAHPTRGLAVLLSACETEEEKAHVRTTVLYALWLIHNAEYGALSQALCAALQRSTREYMAEGDRRMAELLRNAAEEKKKKKKPAAKKPAKKPTVQKKPAARKPRK